jgi:small GTP-binding protein
MSKEDIILKLGVFGESSVGKTCILNRYVLDSFNPEHDITCTCEILEKIVEYGNKTLNLKLWDTAGQERLYTITKQYYQGLQGLLLIYDQTNKESFTKLNNWYTNIDKELNLEKVGVVIVGNKSDLLDKQVDVNEAKLFAEQVKAPFIETSACNNVNIDECFKLLIKEVIKKNQSFATLRRDSKCLSKKHQKKKVSKNCCGK